ncbi:pilus (MSHA type) biogenesis protein MshL [Aquabacterium sp.]|uniref:pilus (MSHA type) biogenesis protein MshL n=1 Tax=Aquabacterium sp. TaxID=1872578 RepID=UPI00199280CC|nr:pilus (MSHA type) biogenesis protein MshL [Aquabacterium sp.]MBC7701682.1 secretin N-terminal domain-containing protein [Aquabacterium sp.]
MASLLGCSTPAGNYRTQTSPMLSLRMDLPTRLGNSDAPVEQVAAAPAPVVRAAPTAPRDERFDLVVNSASTRNVFLALVADTRYSMLLHPEVTGTLSVTLKGVTLLEALESIRDVYGYDFKMDGRRITIFPPTLQTRLFNVNYLNSQRRGNSDVRITSGQGPSTPTGGGSSSTASGSTGAAKAADRQESSQVSTTSTTDLWAEISITLKTMIGTANGRSVVTSPQAGVIAVRGMPDELRQVESFLRSTRFSVERQVMLEAKILEVELRDGFQSGIDWSILGTKSAIGQASGRAGNPLAANSNGLPALGINSGLALAADTIPLPGAGSGILGLSLATKGFEAVLGFLETHGEVQVLSSPRVAAMNNQKAVLKVGSDEFFVTAVQGGSVGSGNNSTGSTTTLPTITLTPFFSGIALDVTPQIDDGGMITLHIHPSVTAVSTVTKQIDLGAVGNYKLPLAYSSVNETDTIVRIPDGNIVAIGGLMQMESNRSRSGMPGSGANQVTSTLFGNRIETSRKKEVVVLIKPTIIRSTEDWQATAVQAREAMDRLDAQLDRRVIKLDGNTEHAEPVPAPSPLRHTSKRRAGTP